MEARNLTSPDLYINRYDSLLEFNRRVMAYATDAATPLLERLKFLCITSSNLDEFFEIRVASLKQRVGSGNIYSPDDRAPEELLRILCEKAHEIVAEQYRVLNDSLIPELAASGIVFLRRGEWAPDQELWLRTYFTEQVLPVLSPLGLDPSHPFPQIINKSLNFIVSLEGVDAFGRRSGKAIVHAPRALPRLIQIPAEICDKSKPHSFVFLSSIIHAFVDQLFPGMEPTGCYQFRVTRNSDLFVDEEEAEDLLHALEGELRSRRYGDAVRLEVADNCPDELIGYLRREFNLKAMDVYQVNGPVNLNRLIAIPDLVDMPELKYPGFRSSLPTGLAAAADIFQVLRRGPVLLHHPFESFAPVIDFVRQAARDPQVLAIKQTLYRTGPESAIVDALVDAARAGKEVTVVIELRARFDEEANIQLANRLQQAGALVVYGIVGYKCHAKMVLIVRREAGELRRYTHLGTGNYHPRTARLYTDYGLLTADQRIGGDVNRVFHQMTSLGKVSQLDRLLESPFTLFPWLLERIAAEAELAQAGKPAHIIFKINALIEPQAIQALYRASQAGVKIDLIVRSMCSLRPGIPGVSDNIRVRSVVGRFLEHTRVYCFGNGGEELVYLGSADLRERNLFQRVEVVFPVDDEAQRARVCEELQLYLADNTQAWELDADGAYRRVQPAADAQPVSAQATLLARIAS
ncbi:MAG: polyphosphate kinase 1 [Chromatiales bacterium]|nr:polyphosphate kinase 1 [Chromatiales bacterium]